MLYFRTFGACAILIVMKIGQFHAAAERGALSSEVVLSAIQKAEQTLYEQIGGGAAKRRSLLGVDLSRHSYVKLTELTEKIGFESNKNLLTYQQLLRLRKTQILSSLATQRPEIFTQVPDACSSTYTFRSINGTCNNLRNPLWGSILTPFVRLAPAVYSDGFNEQKGGRQTEASRLPNVRLVSSSIHGDLIHPDPTITNFVPMVGLIVDHDTTLTPEGDKPCCSTAAAEVDCWSIPVYANDSFFGAPGRAQRCLDFTRSTPYCFPTPSGVREQMNILTAFIDASFVYGSDDERAFQLRSFVGGKMRTSRGNPGLLPTVAEVEEDLGEHIEFMGTFLGGDERVNEMPELTVMHTLWLREHNRIAAQIGARRPSLTDEEIFQETRRILIAEWQNVVYSEYLPVILGPNAMQKFGVALPSSTGAHSIYNSGVDPSIMHAYSTAAYRFGHTLINGLFRLMRDGVTEVGSFLVRDNFFESAQVTRDNGDGVELILGGLFGQNAQTYDDHVTEDLTNFLLRKKEDDFGSDLVARNLQRGRDHALPGYNEYRSKCFMPQVTTWRETPAEVRPEVWTKLQSLYDRPADIDLFTAGLSEYPVPDGVSGPIFNCIKSLQFAKLKDGDRFFFTHAEQPRPFTGPQLQNIRARRLSDIICENSNIRAAPANVFRTMGSMNPAIPCSDLSRPRLDFDTLLG